MHLAASEGIRFWLVAGLVYTLLPIVAAGVWLWRGALAGIVVRTLVVAVAGSGLVGHWFGLLHWPSLV
jgi:uncharacterized membrane protein YagU involved in acid resistance